MIPRSFIDDLIQQVDIADVVGERVPLKKKGKNLSSCCPFHDEKTPSFSVNSVQQFYYCFGCGAGGNVVSFIMEYERLSFIEAVEMLAQRQGLEIPHESQSYQKRIDPTIYDVLLQTSNYYQQQLPQSEQAQTYINGRDLSTEIINRFAIGYSPTGWDNLLKLLGQTEQQQKLLMDAGLLVQRDNNSGSYDRFRHRIMFPIRDTRGRTIGFGGRVLSSADNPKYLNSPETEVFHKSEELYGLYEALHQRKSFDSIIVVEGYMDVIALSQHGVNNSVATLGTAIGIGHLKKLFKYTGHVIFCFDGDDAGRRAAHKALETCLPLMIDGRQAQFLFLAEGEDPDSCVRDQGTTYFEQQISSAQTLSSYLLASAAAGINNQAADGKAAMAKNALAYISKLPTGIMKQLILQELATVTNLPTSYLETHLLEQKTITPTSRQEPTIDNIPYEDIGGNDDAMSEIPFIGDQNQQLPVSQNINTSPSLAANRMLVLMLFCPAVLTRDNVDWLAIQAQQNGQLLVAMKKVMEDCVNQNFSSFIGYLGGSEYSHWACKNSGNNPSARKFWCDRRR